MEKQFSFHQSPNQHCNVRVSQKPIRAGFWSKVEGWMDWICDQGWVLSPHLNPDPSSLDPVPIHSLFATNQLRCLRGISQFWFTNKKPSTNIKSKWALGDKNLMTEIMMMLMMMISWWPPSRTWGRYFEEIMMVMIMMLSWWPSRTWGQTASLTGLAPPRHFVINTWWQTQQWWWWWWWWWGGG